MVSGVPFRNPASGPSVLSEIVRPMMPGSRWKYRCHALELMTMTLRACRFVAHVERAPEQRARAEHVEGIRRDERAAQPRGAVRRGHQGDRRAQAEHHVRQRRGARAPFGHLGPAHPVRRGSGLPAVRGAARSTIAYQSIGVLVRQRLEEHGIDDAEDGGGGANAEAQRDDGGGEAWVPGERPSAVPEIAPEISRDPRMILITRPPTPCKIS